MRKTSNGLRAMAQHGDRIGGIRMYRFGRLFIAMDNHDGFVGVVLYTDEPGYIVSTVHDRPIDIRRVTAQWAGPLPRRGEYLMAGARARSAFQIARDPRFPSNYDGSTPVRLGIDIRRVNLPLPPSAVVHRWRWTCGSRGGAVVRDQEA